MPLLGCHLERVWEQERFAGKNLTGTTLIRQK